MNNSWTSLNEFRQHCRDFLKYEGTPHQADWERQGWVDRTFWEKAGDAGLLGMGVPREFGGLGESDYSFAVVLTEELIRADVTAPGIISHNDAVASYILQLGTDEQKARWLPDLCRGHRIAAIAVTEPSGGSDSSELLTTAEREDDHFRLNGSKAYITNGINADLIIVAVKTGNGPAGQGISLLVLERGSEGFTRGPLHNKLGWHASDTADLYFDNCHLPETQLLGREHMGNLHFMSGMPRERLSIATVAVASAESMLRNTLEYIKDRRAFGQPIGSFQHNRFLLARLDTEVRIARVYLDDAVQKFNRGEFSLVEAARVKWWTTELQVKVADHCLQLHGGAGYMSDSVIGRAWANSRVQTIYGGTSEIMQEMISRSMGL